MVGWRGWLCLGPTLENYPHPLCCRKGVSGDGLEFTAITLLPFQCQALLMHVFMGIGLKC